MGKLSKLVGAVKAVKNIKDSDNPGETAGNIVAGAARIAHPILGTMAAPMIKKGTEAAVNKGIEIANDPNVQAKTRDIVGRVQSGINDVIDKGRSGTFHGSVPPPPPPPRKG